MTLYYLQNQLILHIKECKHLKKCYSSNRQKRMVASFNISAILTAKFELVFVLTQENTFPKWFHFKANRKSIDSSEKRY